MKTHLLVTAGVVASLGFAHTSLAGGARVDGLGGPLTLQSGPLPTLFGSASPTFTSAALETVNTSLNDDGVATNGKVTALLADTGDAGLSWIVLIDDEIDPDGFKTFTSSLGFNSTADNARDDFINDAGDAITVTPGGSGFQTADGVFEWDSAEKGDGFGWAELLPGDFMTFNFFNRTGPDDLPTFPGLMDDDTFQFVTWDAGAGEWQLVATEEFTVGNQFAYSVTILTTPLPSAAGLGFVGLGLLGARRRR